MGELPKIQLSAEETELINNAEWFLAKHSVIKKVYELFSHLQTVMQTEIRCYKYLFREDIKNQKGKITRGESYLLLPYVVLDYPTFWKNDILAIRTMFWWGNFFSVTLQLSGVEKEKFTADPTIAFSYLQKNDFFICINEDAWQHHFEEDNYKGASTLSLTEFELILKNPFFKIAKKISVKEWKKTPDFVIKAFREILVFLTINYPIDKKDLSPEFPKAGSDL